MVNEWTHMFNGCTFIDGSLLDICIVLMDTCVMDVVFISSNMSIYFSMHPFDQPLSKVCIHSLGQFIHLLY